MIFLSQVIDVPIAGDTKSLDYSRDVLQIAMIFSSQVIDVPIAGDTKSIDYSRDVLLISMIIPSQRISKVYQKYCSRGVLQAWPHVSAGAHSGPRMPALSQIWQREPRSSVSIEIYSYSSNLLC